MFRTTRIAAIAAGACIVAGGLTFGATAANAGSPIPAPGSYAATYAAALAAVQAAAANGGTVAAPAGVSGTTVRTRTVRARRATGTAPTLSASALALAAEINSGKHTPCQFASEPGSLLVFGNYPGETYVVQFTIRGVPVELKTGKLTTRGTSLKAVPRDWNAGNVRVWAGATRCTLT